MAGQARLLFSEDGWFAFCRGLFCETERGSCSIDLWVLKGFERAAFQALVQKVVFSGAHPFGRRR
jgi:hypothetical protein